MKIYDYEKKHLQLLRSNLSECTVLLKCNGDFPLEDADKIAAYGSGVRYTVKGGTGSGEVNSRYFVNVEKGLQNAGFTITTKTWLDAYDKLRLQAKSKFIKKIKLRARKKRTNAVMEGMGAVMPEPEYDLPLYAECDVAIYVLSRISGEGNDRNVEYGDIKLSKTEVRDILELQHKYEKFMLVLNVGGVVDLSGLTKVKNILYLSQLGVETGDVLADILLGKSNPSGKLTTTWSAWEDYSSHGEFGKKDTTRYIEGIYVGYRYFDSVGKRAMFPFGYGKSYTNFHITTDSVTIEKDKVLVTATVTNTGSFSGKEVVQVYVSSPQGKLDKPYQALAGFAKTPKMTSGETKQIEISFNFSDLASYDPKRSAYILESGNYVIRIGNSSVDTYPVKIVALDGEVLVTKVRPCCGKPDFEDWKPKKHAVNQNYDNVPVIKVDAIDFKTVEIAYDQRGEIEDLVKTLTKEQLAVINVGAFKKTINPLSVIGEASSNVAGAAGETTTKLKDKGFTNLIMADGPAGLRLSPMYYMDKKGVHSIGPNPTIEGIADFIPKPIKLLLKLMNKKNAKAKKGYEVKYQYATAIPIGTALAQSWNLKFAHDCGDIVGNEMKRFGVHLWLAPALNIHRDIRCGRNFEYFSEDPLLSGKFAAAVTKGVQKNPGCGATIKHFAANNQEYSRYNNNSIVSERAMREIYLKGFHICVRQSQPLALMTSYNLLNGEHTSESKGLIEDVLRSEYGFEGIVMTDWIVAQMNDKKSVNPAPRAHKIAAAGGDLVMPGSKADYSDILKGLKEGALTIKQLQINASRVFKITSKLIDFDSEN